MLFCLPCVVPCFWLSCAPGCHPCFSKVGINAIGLTKVYNSHTLRICLTDTGRYVAFQSSSVLSYISMEGLDTKQAEFDSSPRCEAYLSHPGTHCCVMSPLYTVY